MLLDGGLPEQAPDDRKTLTTRGCCCFSKGGASGTQATPEQKNNNTISFNKGTSAARGVPFFFVSSRLKMNINSRGMLADTMDSDCTVQDILEILDTIASTSLAESWDNVGLMVGDPAMEAAGVLVALDPTESLLDEALECGANIIITHHPLIFHPLKSIRTDLPLGGFLSKAMMNRIAVIGCHTNLDVVTGGVNDVLAAGLGLLETEPLTESKQSAGQELKIGFGRIGHYSTPIGSDDFIKRLGRLFDLQVIGVAGKLPDRIETVALCGGSGSDLAEIARDKGAQVYLTAEIKHSVARWAEESGFCIIDGGHFATENPVVPVLVDMLRTKCETGGKTIDIRRSVKQKSPFVFYTPDGR